MAKKTYGHTIIPKVEHIVRENIVASTTSYGETTKKRKRQYKIQGINLRLKIFARDSCPDTARSHVRSLSARVRHHTASENCLLSPAKDKRTHGKI